MPLANRSSCLRLAGLALLAATTATAAQDATRSGSASGGAGVPSDSELVASIDQIAADALAAPGGVGLSIAIARHGEIILAKGYGLAEVEHDVATDEDAMFRIGSVTKQFTAALVMKLVERGKLSLDDSISKYFPDFPLQGHEVTVRHLLNHTSGIKSYTDIDEIMQKHIAYDMTVDELLSWVKDLPFDFPPGEQYKYNNTAYYMLGTVIEKASGVPYCQYLQDEICVPLGLASTRCDSNADIIPDRAQGYGFEDGKIVNDRLIGMDNPGGAGMLISSARDLVAWTLALEAGKVVSAESYAQMTTPTILPDGTNTHYGFGLGMGAFQGHRTIGHGGGIFGFTSMLTSYPDDDLIVAVISNGRVNPRRVSQDITRAALGLEYDVPSLPVDDALAARLTGVYAFADIPLELIVTTKGGEMYMQGTNQPDIKLLYQGDGEFRASFDTEVRIVFDITTTDGPCPSLQLYQGGATRTATRKEGE